jgi:hypothetical protein
MLQLLRHLSKRNMERPCDVVAKDKCFYFAHNEGVDEDNDNS